MLILSTQRPAIVLKSQPVCASDKDVCAMSGAGGPPLTVYLGHPRKGWWARDANIPRTQLRMARGDELRAPISSLVNDTRWDSIAAPP